MKTSSDLNDAMLNRQAKEIDMLTKQRDEYLEERDAAITDANYFRQRHDEVIKQRDDLLVALENLVLDSNCCRGWYATSYDKAVSAIACVKGGA